MDLADADDIYDLGRDNDHTVHICVSPIGYGVPRHCSILFHIRGAANSRPNWIGRLLGTCHAQLPGIRE